MYIDTGRVRVGQVRHGMMSRGARHAARAGGRRRAPAAPRRRRRARALPRAAAAAAAALPGGAATPVGGGGLGDSVPAELLGTRKCGNMESWRGDMCLLDLETFLVLFEWVQVWGLTTALGQYAC